MTEARCQCGALAVALTGEAGAVVACHCEACQRRSGSPFGVLAYYPEAQVQIRGEAVRFARGTDSGGTFETFFCPTCGSTVFVRASIAPGMIGVTVGAICDPAYPAPIRSVWEQTRHHWVTIPEPMQHFPRGRR